MEKIETPDGSYTFYSEKYTQTYHSRHGAKTESKRVFLELGMEYAAEMFGEINILEMGWGTGLNSYMTRLKTENEGIKVKYTSIEAFPIQPDYYSELPAELIYMHELSWDEWHQISDFFRLRNVT